MYNKTKKLELTLGSLPADQIGIEVVKLYGINGKISSAWIAFSVPQYPGITCPSEVKYLRASLNEMNSADAETTLERYEFIATELATMRRTLPPCFRLVVENSARREIQAFADMLFSWEASKAKKARITQIEAKALRKVRTPSAKRKP